MKFAVVFAAIVAVAVASPHLSRVDPGLAELEAIIAAIQSPSTDPATGALLEQQLAEILAELNPEVVEIAPVVVAEDPSPISVGPAIIDFPLPDGGAASPGLTPVVPEVPAIVEAPIAPAPVVVEGNAQSSPLVQIIVNIQSSSAVAPAPVETPVEVAPVETPVLPVDPVIVAEEAVNVDTIVLSPVTIVDAVPEVAVPEPVEVVETPVVVEPIQIATPVLPQPVILLPDILN